MDAFCEFLRADSSSLLEAIDRCTGGFYAFRLPLRAQPSHSIEWKGSTPFRVSRQLLLSLGRLADQFEMSLEFWQSLVHPEDWPGLIGQYGKASDLADSSATSLEYRLLHADGTYRYTRERGLVYRESSSRQIHWLGVLQGIDQQVGFKRTCATETQPSDESLARNDTQFREVFHSSPVGMLLVDRQGQIQLCNPEIEKMFGYDEGELEGRSLETLVPQGARLKHQSQRANFDRKNVSRRMGAGREFLGVQKDGSSVHVEVSLTKLVIGDVPMTLANVVDVTERNRSESRLRLAGEVGELGFWEMDLSTQRVQVSAALLNQLGLNEPFDDYEGFNQYVHPDDQQMVLDQFRQFLDGEDSHWECVVRMRHAQGGYRWILTRGRKQRDVWQRVYRIVGFHVDITQQQNLQIELGRKTEELQRSNQELQRFAYVASHDLKAPLGGIRHLTQWIEEDMPEDCSSEVREHLSRLKDQANRMEVLLEDALAYARLGKGAHQPEDLNLDELIRQLFTFLLPGGDDKLTVSGVLPVLKTYRAPLEQVVRNLLSNAIQHGDSGDLQVEVGARPIPSGYEFFVRDNGPGIARIYQDRIFEMFQSLKPKAEGAGTGMGLTLVRRILEMHDGRVWVESKLGQGATFFFTWPNIEIDETSPSV